MAQRYSSPTAHERMAEGLCPECGESPHAHSQSQFFWLRPAGCDLTPEGVNDRVAQHQQDTQ